MGNRKDLTVLLVDDDQTYLQYQQWVLEEMGIDVITTTDSSTVLDKVVKFDPDLLILDKMMPIDGLLIAEECIKEFPYLPVLIVTAGDYTCDKKKALTLGCIDYIKKGSDKKAFLSRVLDYCVRGYITKKAKQIEEKWDKLDHIWKTGDRRNVNFG